MSRRKRRSGKQANMHSARVVMCGIVEKGEDIAQEILMEFIKSQLEIYITSSIEVQYEAT